LVGLAYCGLVCHSSRIGVVSTAICSLFAPACRGRDDDGVFAATMAAASCHRRCTDSDDIDGVASASCWTVHNQCRRAEGEMMTASSSWRRWRRHRAEGIVSMVSSALHRRRWGRRRCHPSFEDGLLDEGRLFEEEDGHI
jgi:hypothetical protein